MSVALQDLLLEESKVSINLILSLIQAGGSLKILELSSSDPLATNQVLINFFPLFISSAITHLSDRVC